MQIITLYKKKQLYLQKEKYKMNIYIYVCVYKKKTPQIYNECRNVQLEQTLAKTELLLLMKEVFWERWLKTVSLRHSIVMVGNSRLRDLDKHRNVGCRTCTLCLIVTFCACCCDSFNVSCLCLSLSLSVRCFDSFKLSYGSVIVTVFICRAHYFYFHVI